MEKIAVSKSLLIGLGVAFALSLLALVFYIGRESARRDANPIQSQAAPAAVQSGMVEAPNAQDSEATPSLNSPGTPSTPSPTSSTSAAADPVRASVVAYFETIDQIQPGQMSGDASSVANKIVEDLSKGDTSGLDGMIQQAESARKRLASLTPPLPCATYHRDSLASLDDGLEVMRSMKKALKSSDANGLSALTEKGNAMRSRSEALAREEKAIRLRYGMTR